MAGLAIVIPRNGPGTGPVIPPPAHDVGVSGWDHRYIATDLADGTVTTWADRGAVGAPLTRDTGGTATKVTEGGFTFARVSMPESASVGGLTDGKAVGATARTVSLVMRYSSGTSASTPTFARAGGLTLSRASNGSLRVAGTGTQNLDLAGPAVGLWRIVIFTLNTPVLRIGDTENTTASTWSPSGTSDFWVGVSGANAGGGTRAVDYAEIVQWPKVLTASERTAHVTAMRAKYSGI
jgi:hypothetical protein